MSKDITTAKWLWLVALAGPAAWPIIFLIATAADAGPGGAWSVGMAVMYTGAAIVIAGHILACLFLIGIYAYARFKKKPIGASVIVGLAYYIVVVVGAMLYYGGPLRLAWIYSIF